MKTLNSIRVDNETLHTLNEAANHCGMDISEFCRRVGRRMKSAGESAYVVHMKFTELYHVLRFRDVKVPEWATADKVRTALLTESRKALKSKRIDYKQVKTVEWK